MGSLTKIVCSLSNPLFLFYFAQALILSGSVHTPSNRRNEDPLLPVIVYMHGGGSVSFFTSGPVCPHTWTCRYDAGNTSLYPVQDFVKGSDYGLVAVSIQYRLGVFGK